MSGGTGRVIGPDLFDPKCPRIKDEPINSAGRLPRLPGEHRPFQRSNRPVDIDNQLVQRSGDTLLPERCSQINAYGRRPPLC